MTDQKLVSGYVRSGATYVGTEWNFEVLSERPKVVLAAIMTADGLVQIGLSRAEVVNLTRKLQLLLANWPDEDRAI